MYGVSNNNDVFGILNLNSLIYSISNQEQFCFYRCDIYCMMNCFGQNTSTRVNLWNWSSNVLLNASIRDNENSIWIFKKKF